MVAQELAAMAQVTAAAMKLHFPNVIDVSPFRLDFR